VGDNVGDVAGMGADLFESYVGSIIAPISLVAFSFLAVNAGASTEEIAVGNVELLVFPMFDRLRRHDRVDHRLVLRQGRRLHRLARAEPSAPHGHQRRDGDHRGRHRARGYYWIFGDADNPLGHRPLGDRRSRRRLGPRQVRRVLHLRPLPR
jgi:hypothetical protein